MESVYEICFYGGLILAIVLFVIAVVLFIALKIPKVIGDLTGRSAKKVMKSMKEGEAVKSSISKREQAKYYNQSTGRIRVREATNVNPNKTEAEANAKPDTRATTDSEADEEATAVLAGTDEEATDVLAGADEAETSVLMSEAGEAETTVLAAVSADRLARRVKVIYNIIEVHTEECL